MASAPASTAWRASSGSRMPLMISLPGHRLRTHAASCQLSVGSNWLAIHSERAQALAAGRQRIGEVAETLVRRAQHRPRPAGLAGNVEQVTQGQFRRHGQAVFEVAMTLAE